MKKIKRRERRKWKMLLFGIVIVLFFSMRGMYAELHSCLELDSETCPAKEAGCDGAKVTYDECEITCETGGTSRTIDCKLQIH